MYWDQMTIDEYARCQQAEGLKVLQIDGVYWVEIRPFFFRPLFPFTRIAPQSKRYPKKASLGGYLHAVPAGVTANATMNFFVYDDLKNYSISNLNAKRRKAITKGMKNFTVKLLTDQDEFADQAYQVYRAFQKRTNYSYKAERVNRQAFEEWSKSLFSRPKVIKTGVYLDGRLCAVETSYLIEDVIIGDALFVDDAALKMEVTDFIYHVLREAAAQTDASYFFAGFPTGVKSLDESKFIRGCKLLRVPACYKLNPITRSVVKVFMKTSYQKLLQIIAPPVQAEPLGTQEAIHSQDEIVPSPQPQPRLPMIAYQDRHNATLKKTAPLVHQGEPLQPENLTEVRTETAVNEKEIRPESIGE